jgi:hypothetical protein
MVEENFISISLIIDAYIEFISSFMRAKFLNNKMIQNSFNSLYLNLLISASCDPFNYFLPATHNDNTLSY